MTQTKLLPTAVTHLDIIKTVAVIIMIVDHIGFYFFPDQLWFRAIGRVGGAPVWFFLIGYAVTRDLPNRLLIGALILTVADLALFQSVFAMSALVTIILLRLIIDPVMRFMLQSRYLFFLSSVLMALFYFATNLIVEYGTLALMFAVAGYLVRHRKDVFDQTFMSKPYYWGYIVFTMVIFCVLQNATFGFNNLQFICMSLFSVLTMAVLVHMKSMTFPKIDGRGTKQFLQYCGRNTLDIYVAHLLLFKVIVFATFVLK